MEVGRHTPERIEVLFSYLKVLIRVELLLLDRYRTALVAIEASSVDLKQINRSTCSHIFNKANNE